MPLTSKSSASGISYRRIGSGPAVVLLHGFPAGGDLWHNIWNGLSVSHTVIIPDLPGCGNSPLAGEKSIAETAGLIAEIVREEQQDKIVLAGHSMGGYIALALADSFPNLVAGLSLVHSTSAPDDEEKKKARLNSIDLIQKGGKHEFISKMVPGLFSPSFKQSAPRVVKEQVERSMEIPESALINFNRAMMKRQDTTAVLESAKFPVQWVCGTDDNVIPIKKILGKSHISDINFVTFYNNCGHMSMLEAPAMLVDDVAEFASFCYNREDVDYE